MPAQAKGTFTVSAWDENTYEELENGGKLTKAHVTFALDGDMQGEGGWDAVMCYQPDGTASFAGFQFTTGKLGGKQGAFVLRADGTFSEGQARTYWQVVDGSATGELAGLRGSGTAVTTGATGGEFTIDYELG
ncbi:MAG: DUF3224 domain-containing protein [Streptosporangiaceae bacterium]